MFVAPKKLPKKNLFWKKTWFIYLVSPNYKEIVIANNHVTCW